MKVNSTLVIVGFSILLFVASCSNSANKKKQASSVDESQVEVSEQNPNGDSELAILMRALFEEGEVLKQDVAAGKMAMTDDYIKLITDCHTATPTDPDVKTDEYTAFTNLLLIQAQKMQEPDVDQEEVFNELVNRCMTCHETFCPGPMKRIKKLYIQ